ncbi:RHS repeat-associated core domain-containing protein [Roseimaritima sediminicola]|uniref:RHS repeat-associated core domain-containing protein n=1 Tax=Roseimaritima sediminicola TaxID=2662066 RepID=UPI0013875ED6|nr:RHS repeat-associated core domain-containing protein [Roseimaritima sediminicola]
MSRSDCGDGREGLRRGQALFPMFSEGRDDDVFGNIVNVTDPLGNETVYTYNRLNQLVTEGKVYGSGTQNRSYAYDGAANLRSRVDRNDRLTEWDYDNRYRVSSETWKTGATVDRTLTYAYDTSDRTTSIDDSDPLATDFQFAYNDRSQLLAERQLTGLVGTSVALNRAFDGNGNRITLGANFGGTLSGTSIVGGVDDFTRQFTYDGLGRMTSVNSDAVSGGHAVAPQLATFEYNAASQRTDLRQYSATTASPSDLQVHSRRAYDQAGRLASITHGTAEIGAGETWDGTSTLPASLGSTDMLAGYFFRYDQDNRLVDFASYRDGTETSFGYDSRDQLTSATTAAIAGLSQPFGLASSESYDFDAGGNRKSSGGQSQSAANTHNQLQTDGTYNYTYDDEGNTLSKTSIATGEVTEYAWDHRNRMVLVTERASAGGAITQQVEFIYDAFDQRVGKRVDSDGDGTWDRDEAFVWADGQTVLRFVDSDGEAVSESFRVANRYLYGDVVDEVLADEQYAAGSGPAVNSSTASATASETLWTIADHLGSVRDLVDNNGVVRQHMIYDSFGNRLVEQDYDTSGTAIASSHASAVDTLFGYTGRDWDADVELQNNRARWYDPTTGRWLSQDPIGFAAGDANLYRYVGNGVTTKVDPSGLDESTIIDIPVQGVKGIGQGAVNTVNGIQDTATGLGNLFIWIPNAIADGIDWVDGTPEHQRMRIPYIPYSDWSRDMVVHESDTCHNISKFAGAAGVETLSGVGIARLGTAVKASGTVLSKAERLAEFYRRLANAPGAKSADEALDLIGKTLDDVEDAYSGVAKSKNPGLEYDGRMYPPQSDNIRRTSDGCIQVRTKGNRIDIGKKGDIEITDLDGNTILSKPGG